MKFKIYSDKQKEILDQTKEFYKSNFKNAHEKETLEVLSIENKKIAGLNSLVKNNMTQITNTEYVDTDDLRNDVENIINFEAYNNDFDSKVIEWLDNELKNLR